MKRRCRRIRVLATPSSTDRVFLKALDRLVGSRFAWTIRQTFVRVADHTEAISPPPRNETVIREFRRCRGPALWICVRRVRNPARNSPSYDPVSATLSPAIARPALRSPSIRCSTSSGSHHFANSSRATKAKSGLNAISGWRASRAASISPSCP
jgi:hypothetical protein